MMTFNGLLWFNQLSQPILDANEGNENLVLLTIDNNQFPVFFLLFYHFNLYYLNIVGFNNNNNWYGKTVP